MQLIRGEYNIEELVKFVHSIYLATNGAYPLLEWVDKKPLPGDFKTFEKIYTPFLKERLEKEFDELYIWREKEIIGTGALVYNFEGKQIPWIPSLPSKAGFIEFLMVSPSHQGKGYGKKILFFLINRLHELAKDAYVVTSPFIDAYSFYKKQGFREVSKYKEFVMMKYERL